VFTKIDPKTGRPEYDETKKPVTGKKIPFCPSLWGGKDWPPAAYNPKTGYLYIRPTKSLRLAAGHGQAVRGGQALVGHRD